MEVPAITFIPPTVLALAVLFISICLIRPGLASEAPYDWSGSYAGASAAYNWNLRGGQHDCIDNVGILNGPTCQTIGPNTNDISFAHGILAGLQAGRNWQLQNNLIWGIEADLNGSTVGGKRTFYGPFSFVGSGGTATPAGISASRLDIEWMGSVRARLGYKVADHRMLYVTGGLAFAGIYASSLFTAPNVGTNYQDSIRETKFGVTAGLGVEQFIDDKISVKFEGLYYDLGSVQTFGNEEPFSFGPNGYTHGDTFDVRGWSVRLGVNFMISK